MSRNKASHPKGRHVTEEPSKSKCLCMLTTTTKKQERQHNNLANPWKKSEVWSPLPNQKIMQNIETCLPKKSNKPTRNYTAIKLFLRVGLYGDVSITYILAKILKDSLASLQNKAKDGFRGNCVQFCAPSPVCNFMKTADKGGPAEMHVSAIETISWLF